MRKFYFLFLLSIIVVLPVFSKDSPGRFGFRPVINLDEVSADAIEPGQLRIKFAPAMDRHLDAQAIHSVNGVVQFGVSALDQVSRELIIRDVKSTFSGPSMLRKYEDRHRAWGLHRWYDISLDHDTDIVEAVRRLKALDEIDVAEPVYRKQIVSGKVFDWNEEDFLTPDELRNFVPNDPQFSNQWHYNNTGQSGGNPGADISLTAAWDIEKGSPDVLVAIIDDGIQYTHPDLAGNMWDGIGFNFVDNNSNVIPGDHGTHVAGTVAAVTNNGVGVAGVAGGSGNNDGVRLMSAQVFRGFASGGFPNAFIWAADNDASIAQNSWGYTQAGVVEQVVLDAIDYFNANGGGDILDGGITIFAAGNSNSSGQWYPGYYEGAFSVAATNHSDQRANYSTYGTWVDISAPGGETNVSNIRGVLSTVTNSSYAYYQGTSMACPHVSGAAALVLSYIPGVLTNQELWDLLVSTTDDHYASNPGFIGQLGSGRLNAHALLLEAENYLSGLINPSAFSAVAIGTDVIELSWQTNAENDDILLAFSTDGVFGTPDNIYSPGDQIAGGGIVLLAGQDESFTHTGLEAATQYFYRIWSQREGDYSSGRGLQTETFCGIFSLPFTEDFTDSVLPLCWETSASSGSEWQVGSFSGGLNIETPYAYSGTALSSNQNASLVTPMIDMSQYEEVTVSFSHYLRNSFLGSTAGIFSYSLNDGQSWTTVNSWSGTTANPATFETSLPELAGESMVRLRWTVSIGWLGYYWTVGNIHIEGVSAGNPQIDVEPQVVNMEIENNANANESITIHNQGSANLVVEDLEITYHDDAVDYIEVEMQQMLIAPGESELATLDIDATMLEPGHYNASLLIQSNDPDNPEVEVDIAIIVTSPDLFNITFSLENIFDEPIHNAILSLNGLQNEPGEYLFADIQPGNYTYLVTALCYTEVTGEIILEDADKEIHLLMHNIPGDVNDDGIVDVLDVIALVQYYNTFDAEVFCSINADINGDGIIDVLDVIEIVAIYSATD